MTPHALPGHDTLFGAELAYAQFNRTRALRAATGRVEFVPVTGGFATRDASSHDAYYHRIVTRAGIVEQSVADARTFHADSVNQQLDVWSDVLPGTAPARLPRTLQGRGWQPGPAMAVTARPVPLPTRSSPAVRPATPGDFEAVCDVWAAESTPPSARIRAARIQTHFDGPFELFVAESGGRVVAMASVFYHGVLAWFGNANTRPAFRGRGLHRQLIDARLNAAARRGVRWAIHDAESRSTSARNAMAAGFLPLATVRTWRHRTARYSGV